MCGGVLFVRTLLIRVRPVVHFVLNRHRRYRIGAGCGRANDDIPYARRDGGAHDVQAAIDSRLGHASTVFQNDVILGLRLALNDEADQSLLFTGAVDAESAETVLRLEAERRLGEGVSLRVEGQGFVNTDRNILTASLEDDRVLRVK